MDAAPLGLKGKTGGLPRVEATLTGLRNAFGVQDRFRIGGKSGSFQWCIPLCEMGSNECGIRKTVPFVLRFTINVLEGMRPRVKMRGVKFANEGYEKTFELYPGGKANLFSYNHKTKYAVMIKVSSKATELYVNDKLISTISGLKKKPDYFRFCAGDGWSQGAVEYSDVTLSY